MAPTNIATTDVMTRTSKKRVEIRRYRLAAKRLIDILGALFLLAILSPLFLVVAVLIKATSRGPVFFAWHVVGLNERDFKSYKFRSMVEDAELLRHQLDRFNEMSGPVFKMKQDPRVTAVGAFLRRYSLDELPQLISVLKGDMSLVGPRPPYRRELEQFQPWQRRKLAVKPGMTCLWQVNGRNRINDFDSWVRLDLEYIDNWSLMLDFRILAKTVMAVFAGTGE